MVLYFEEYIQVGGMPEYVADLGIKNIITGFRDKGAIFENYVYLRIKDKQPRYIYQETIELDFFTKDKVLIEVKYDQELVGKQKDLFKKFPAKQKNPHIWSPRPIRWHRIESRKNIRRHRMIS